MPSKQTSTTSTDMGPWSGQQPFIKEAFSEAQSIYNKNKANPYTGDYIAQPGQNMFDMANRNMNFYNTTGIDRADNIYGTSQGLLDKGAAGIGNAAGGLFDMAGADRIGQTLDAANRTANNPFISGMVDSAMLDARRNAGENVLPSLYRNAAGTGNLNSSRTAIAEGIVNRGLAEKAAGISSELRGQAYDTGLRVGQRDQEIGADALARSGALFDSMTGRGFGGIADATGMRNNAMLGGLEMGEAERGFRQMGIDNELAKRDQDYNNLAKYYGIIGANNWGKTGTETTVQKNQPGAAQIAGGVLGGLGSLFGKGGMFGAGGAFGSAGAAAAGGGSMLGSLASFLPFLSDERTKTDVDHLGVDPDTGLNMYAYRYKSDPKTYPKIVGPMAQEVAQKYPDAVSSVGGLLYVNGGKLF